MNTKTLLIASLALNLALGAVVLSHCGARTTLPATNPGLPSTEATVLPAPSPALTAPVVKAAPSTASVQGRPSESKTFGWQAVESPDYRQYIANLRAIGCPEKTIRDIIIADVNELYRGRARTQRSATNRLEYWKGGLANLMPEQSVTRRQAQSAEKRDLLTNLLGPDAPTEPDTEGMLYHMIDALDFLPPDKVTSLMELEQRYQARIIGAMKTASQGDISGLQQILAEHDAETLRMLTPEEKFDYEVRLAPTALRLRMQMGNFEPSEEEFRQIFRLQKAYEDEFSPLGLQSARPEDQQRRQAAQIELNRQMESAMGAARYAEYQQQRATGQRQP